MKSRIAFVLALILASPAYAGDSTVTTAAGTGGPTFHTKTDGSGNNFGFVSIGDGVAGANSVTVKPASTASVAGDSPLVVALHPSSPTPSGTNTIGAVTQASGPWTSNLTQIGGTAISSNAGAATAGSARVVAAQDTSTIAGSAPGTAGSASTNVVTVQGISGGVAVPVSAASLPLPTSAATAANQTNVQSAAGTSASTLVTVQGSASGVAVPVSAASLPLPTGAATAANQSTANTSLATIATNTAAAVPAGTNLIGNVGQVYPAGSTAITASATGTTGATTATLAASASLHTWICGFSIRANATAAATGNATVTGVVTATMNFTQWTAPNASGLGVTEEVFTPCVESSATNTGIAVISAAPGTGGVVSVSAWGFQL